MSEEQGKLELDALMAGAAAFDDPAKLRAMILEVGRLEATYPSLAAEISKFTEQIEAMLVALEVKEEQEKLAAASEPENEEEKDDRDEQDKELEQKLAAIEQAIAKNNVKLNKLEQDYHKDDEKAEALNKEWDTAFAKDLKDMTAFEKAITHGEEDELSKDEKKKLKDHYKLLGRRSENNYSAIDLAEDNMAKRAEERAAIEKDLERIKEQDPENYQDNAKVKNLHKQLEALAKEDQKGQ